MWEEVCTKLSSLVTKRWYFKFLPLAVTTAIAIAQMGIQDRHPVFLVLHLFAIVNSFSSVEHLLANLSRQVRQASCVCVPRRTGDLLITLLSEKISS